MALSFVFTSPALGQSLFDEIGYTQLQNEFGVSLPDGSNVSSALIEAGTNYMPSASGSGLTGKTIVNVSDTSDGLSGHSTASAVRLFGTTGVSPGVDNVDVYNANDWFNNYMRISQTNDPAAQGYQVTSHSYIVFRPGQSPGDVDEVPFLSVTNNDVDDLLQRFDFVNHRDNTLAVVGTANGQSTNLPGGLTPAYNALSVGRSDGAHAAGLTVNYGPNRIKPDLVAPQGSSSAATPVVASAGSLLIDSAGTGTEGARNQVVRSTLLAGATKEEFADWNQTASQPLDERYGAGELNVYNSYIIQQAGQQDGSTDVGGSLVSANGWDYVDDFESIASRFYTFQVDSDQRLDDLSIALAWNREGLDTGATSALFTPVFTLANFDLIMRDESGAIIRSSESSVDNVEHIFIDSLDAGTYQLEVLGDVDGIDYGLSWRSNSISISGVPEPNASVALLAAAMVFFSRRNRR